MLLDSQASGRQRSLPRDDNEDPAYFKYQAFVDTLLTCSILNKNDCILCSHQAEKDEEWITRLFTAYSTLFRPSLNNILSRRIL